MLLPSGRSAETNPLPRTSRESGINNALAGPIRLPEFGSGCSFEAATFVCTLSPSGCGAESAPHPLLRASPRSRFHCLRVCPSTTEAYAPGGTRTRTSRETSSCRVYASGVRARSKNAAALATCQDGRKNAQKEIPLFVLLCAFLRPFLSYPYTASGRTTRLPFAVRSIT